jgi:hypothetical protein
MEIETNPELAQILNALQPTVVVEVPNLDNRNRGITVVPKGTDPPSRPNAILSELLHSSEE